MRNLSIGYKYNKTFLNLFKNSVKLLILPFKALILYKIL